MDEYIDLDSKSAVTIFSYVDILRDNPNEELSMIDLENHISEVIWKLFDSLRKDTAKRLDINEVDLLLTDARVMGVRIDDNDVINPEGFTGKKLEILLSITMVRRDKFAESAYLCEGGSVRAFLLSREIKHKNALYIESHDDVTNVFSISPTSISHLSEFDWGGQEVLDYIRDELGICEDATREVYERYTGGDISSHIGRKFDNMFYTAFDDFVDGLTASAKNSLPGRGGDLPPIYFKSFFPITDTVHNKKFTIGNKKLSLLHVDDSVEVDAFVEDNTHEIYKDLNNLAHRRIKWLMPTE